METMCWNCNHSYDITVTVCPKCGAANGNISLEVAQREVNSVILSSNESEV